MRKPHVSRADAIWLTFVGLAGALVFSLDVTALSLSVLTIGLPVVIATASLRRSLADDYRRWAGRVLDTPIPSPYREPDQPGLARRVTTIVRDPATWRDLLFLIVNSIVGVVLATLSISLFLSGIMYLIYPFLWSVTPPDVFSTNFGVFRVHDLATSSYVMPLGVISLLLWWFWSPTLLRANARLAWALLSPSRSVASAQVTWSVS